MAGDIWYERVVLSLITVLYVVEPDAGIVNFYQNKVRCADMIVRPTLIHADSQDTLMAHVDRSEVCATSPLVSVS